MIRNPSQAVNYRSIFVEQNEFVSLTFDDKWIQRKISTDLGKVDNRFRIVGTKYLQYLIRGAFFIKLWIILEEFRPKAVLMLVTTRCWRLEVGNNSSVLLLTWKVTDLNELNERLLKSVLDNNFISIGTDASNFLPFIPCSYIRFSYLGI